MNGTLTRQKLKRKRASKKHPPGLGTSPGSVTLLSGLSPDSCSPSNAASSVPDSAQPSKESRRDQYDKRNRSTSTGHASRTLGIQATVGRLVPSRKTASISVCIALTLAALITSSVLFEWLVAKTWKARITCESDGCKLLNAMLVEARKKSVSPCENFYRHVCGHWPLKHSGMSVYQWHVSAFLHRLGQFLTQTVVGDQADPTEKMARFYQTCVTVLVDGRDQIAEFRRAFHATGINWPLIGPPDVDEAPTDAFVVAAKVFASFFLSSLLEIRRQLTFTGEVNIIIKPDKGLGVWLRNRALLLKDGVASSAYRDFYEQALSVYHDGSSGAVAFSDFLDIENSVLAQLQIEDRYASQVVLQSVNELSRIMHEDSASGLLEFFSDVYELPDTAKVRVEGTEYVSRFVVLVDELGKDKVVFYLGWVIMQGLWRAMDRRTNVQWYHYFGSRVTADIMRPQEIDCLELTERLLGWSLFYRFTQVTSSEKTTAIVTDVAENLGQMFSDYLATNQWIGEVNVTEKTFADLLYHSQRFNDVTLAARLANLTDMTDSLPANWLAAVKMRRSMPDDAWSDMSTYYVWRLRTATNYSVYDRERLKLRPPPIYGFPPLLGEESTEAANYGGLGSLIGAAALHLIVDLPADSWPILHSGCVPRGHV
ncbi:endothelin-converting enzyme 2-like [Dermacentor silvarum]|uniref:endothelin-converting enzyme 2-like n=1 Tax=Dermacentor silvarum TaxID=543639 RepID=UPI002101CA14|nr:endothelin-converting enzyme 2-like [Dermacentor silvarum]